MSCCLYLCSVLGFWFVCWLNIILLVQRSMVCLLLFYLLQRYMRERVYVCGRRRSRTLKNFLQTKRMKWEMKWNEWIRRKLSTDFWTMHTNADRERYSHTHTRTCTHLCAWVYERQWDMLFLLFLVLCCSGKPLPLQQSQTNAISTGRLGFCCLFNQPVVLLTPIQTLYAYGIPRTHTQCFWCCESNRLNRLYRHEVGSAFKISVHCLNQNITF